MGNLTFIHKLCISACWGLLLMYTAAERQYFISPHNASWADARNHCQVCFKEMVTLTPQNIHVIAKIINSTHWIGLRKYINYNDTYNETDDYDYDSDYDYYNSTNTSSKSFGTPWTLWANGDPIVFQNWYPGFPLFKSPLPKIDCCSCSCTCPAPPRWTTPSPTTSMTSPSPTGSTTGFPTGSVVAEYSSRDSTNITVTESYDNTTDSTSLYDVETDMDMLTNATEWLNTTWLNATEGANITRRANITQPWESTTAPARHTTDSPWTTTPQPPIVSTCERSPMLPPIIPENNKNYIENSCVVILAFGPWVERECFEELPFICYEDRFMGAINVSNITSSSAALQWDQGPGDISHYRFEAFSREGSWNVTKNMHNLSYTLDNLIPGTGYVITVFAVKCERDLNPLNGSFYTIPGEVQNLTVTRFTENTISMNWTKPNGNYGFFEVIAFSALGTKDKIKTVTAEHMDFDNLTQGNEYTFVFRTGVDDRSMWSKNISISNCTRPGKVSNLTTGNISDTYLELQWNPPEGNYIGFKVLANDTHGELNVIVENQTGLLAKPYKVKVSGLQNGTKLDFRVNVLGVCGLEGQIENTTTYTAPGPISNLMLTAKHDNINASWDFTPNPGSNVTFTAKLCLDGKEVDKSVNILNKNVKFDGLKTATQYEVKVYTVLNNQESPETHSFIFTLPSPPTGAKVRNKTTNSLSFEWIPPENSSAKKYNCTLNSTFWSVSRSQDAENTLMCTFTGLQSGSTYDFNVYTLSDNKTSYPASCNGTTVEDPVEISLSMLCTSEEPLYCEKYETKKIVFEELQNHFKEILGDYVYHEVETTSP
ncbi:PREDICTED: fibronectin-like [Poecilia mexicana]|uniref:fibronectin-like n=1 Tax=Poecilia mexicana TaxID=48701 RepID=UPI00072EAF03|nr:PREDICTED: fibronectin-like [Poecilia mexicana]